MNRLWIGLFFALVGGLGGCKKEQPAPPPPQVQLEAAPANPVQPGMEAENPAEKEGQP